MSALLIIRSTFSTFYYIWENPFYEGFFFSNHDNLKESELQIWNNDDINIISNIIYFKDSPF